MSPLTPVVTRAALIALLLGTFEVAAAPTAGDLARLDSDLTPVGAERAGNTAGTIPPWTGGLPQKAVDPAVGYVDPYADDKILFTITADNAEQYKDALSAGQLAMLKAHPESFRLNVYPTRRSAALPAAVIADVKQQAPFARTDGNRVLDVGKSAVPFPITADPLQMMWNHVFRWRGGSSKRELTWSAVAGTGRYFTVRYLEAIVFDQQGYMAESSPNRLFNIARLYLAPPNLEGQLTLLWEPIDSVADSRATWVYETLVRRVRRLPSLAYDFLDPRTQGLRTSDQYDGWNGAPDRYDWTLVGKREVVIPYNSYRLADRKLKYAEILKPDYVNPEVLRYELHRVWVIEANLRQGERHRYTKRVFYLDEDTWQVALEDDYDSKGELWRFGSHPAIQFYDVDVPWYAATIHYDFKANAYIASNLSNEGKFAWEWGWKGEKNEFLPGNLRRLGTR